MLFLAEETTTTSDKLASFISAAIDWVTTSGLKLLVGLIVLFIAFKIINVISKKVKKTLDKRNVDKTISQVVYSVLRKGTKLILFICLLGYVGFDTAAFASLFAAVGVGVSLAMQGSLSNFAGGLVILVTRPFRVGDFVEAQGVSGTVEEIQMFYTNFVTPDNKAIMIPNGALANGTIINYSKKDTRRVDLVFGISYSADIAKAKEVIKSVALSHEAVMHTPAPFIAVSEQADSSVNIVCRLWTSGATYWDVYFFMMEEVKNKFDEMGIEIPFPQLDVNLKK